MHLFNDYDIILLALQFWAIYSLIASSFDHGYIFYVENKKIMLFSL